MPREMVKNCDDGPWFVKVGWSPGRDVQVGIENDEERSMFWLIFADASLVNQLGEELRKDLGISGPVEGLSDEENNRIVVERLLNKLDVVAPLYRGLWSNLNRHQINDLIRRLRKARDSAFGKDE